MMLEALRRIAVAIAIVVSPLSLVEPVRASETIDPQKQLEDVFGAFKDAAMRIQTSQAKELARWTGPIYLAFGDSAGLERVRTDVETTVSTLAAVVRVPVERVAANDPRVNFLVRASTRNSSGATPCFTMIDWDDTGRLVRVELNLNLSNFERLTRCTNHEILHGFGLRSHPDKAFSVLSYRYNTQAHLTDTDRIILETLYDARLPAAGSMDSIGRIACGLIADRLQVSTDRAASVCERQHAPVRTSLFGRPHENIGQ
jgi:hypothetical protein